MDPLREAQENEYAKIEARYSCKHDVRELRHRRIKDGRFSFVRQCIRCGNTSQPVKKEIALLELAGNTAPDYDDDLEENWRKRKSQEYDEVRARFHEKRVDNYGEYLSSDLWAQMRMKVIQRAGGICEGCLERPAIEVHHLSYEHIGNEFLFELVAVCKHCHEAIHKHKS
jgi:hypothetical protein